MRSANVPNALRTGPFTTAFAARHGVSRTALQGEAWRHLLRDVWVHRDVPDSKLLRVQAVSLVLGDGAFVCGLTAAWVFGVTADDPRVEDVWVGCMPGRRLRQREGCIVKELRVEESDLCVVAGVRMTTPLRTAFDCARWLSLVEAVVVADSLAHAELISARELREYCASRQGWPGLKQARRVVGLIEPLAESPMETRLRLLLVLSGLPCPKAQVIVKARGFSARGDLGYEDFKVMIEYDGAFHWGQRRADDRRRDRMRDLGWVVIVVSAEDYYQAPRAIVERVRSELRKRGVAA
ncbi:MAG: DUF559 domain-containing protein [Frankiaceae bacterium]|nr:DUF559 domain-containing protein [Frankiaceae bacterium]